MFRRINWIFVSLIVLFAVLTSSVDAQDDKGSALEAALNATFLIRSDDLEETLLGSAFRFHRQNIVVTNAHVVGDAKSVLVVSVDGSRHIARVIARDNLRDIAVLQIENGGAVIQIKAEGSSAIGQEVYAIGAPFGASFSITSGIISAPTRQIEANVPIQMIQHDAPINPGSSGGPLVGSDGQLLGMNSQIVDGFRHFIGISYAIPALKLNQIVTKLLAGENDPIVKLGLRLRPLDPKIAQALNVDPHAGVLIDDVRPDEVADKAGIQAGDILISMGVKRIYTPGDMAFALESMIESGNWRVIVMRQGQRVELKLEPNAAVKPNGNGPMPQTVPAYTLADLGLTFTEGGQIMIVTDRSLAHFTGLTIGDRFLAVDGQTSEGESWLASIIVTRPVLVLIGLSDGSTRHFVLDPWQKRGRLMPVSGANVLDQAIVIF